MVRVEWRARHLGRKDVCDERGERAGPLVSSARSLISGKLHCQPGLASVKSLAMNIVVLDGYTLNPGDLSWDALKQIGPCTIHDRTPAEEVVARARDSEVAL